MFANTFQSGFISIFYSVGSNPLQLWDKQVKNGHIRRVVDDEVRSLVLEISGTNVATTYITCPIKPRLSLGIKLPFLVMIIKNMKKYFTFEIQILDDKDMHRRFRVSNFQSTTKVRPFCTTMPIGLSSGWNQVQFNLADFTKRAYGSTYLETTRVQIHANVRIRRIYFSDVLYSDDELPNEYKLFLPTPGTQTAARPTKTEKKESIPKEKRDSRKLSGDQVAALDQEIPSGALPSPESPELEGLEMLPPSEAATDEPPSEPMSEAVEPPSERMEEMTVTAEPTTEEPTVTTEPLTTEPTTEAPSEAPPEAPAEGGEAVEELQPVVEPEIIKEEVAPLGAGPPEESAMVEERQSMVIEEKRSVVAEETVVLEERQSVTGAPPPPEEAPPAEPSLAEEPIAEELPAEEVQPEET
ncbi:fibrous sheath CABYR-binding protein-like [Tenebrio molitor]|uniref:fibrous sheath CABYR-binding protein-like n=1 Tax=Tenebrio molitor TaxID=7067 RepID=UPI001C3B46AE|nr:unnamed protein product [Tenebrio molitor]